MHHNVHWLDVPECVKYKVIVLTRRCLRALLQYCAPVSSGSLRSSLGHGVKTASTFRRPLSARSAVISTGHVHGLRAFSVQSVAGPKLELAVKTVA